MNIQVTTTNTQDIGCIPKKRVCVAIYQIVQTVQGFGNHDLIVSNLQDYDARALADRYALSRLQ